ncbi:hypothetical protein MPH_10155, partial [Macrophomina phaseolina MS6]
MSADEDDGGGYATVGASRRAARLQARRTDYHALHTGKPTRQRGNHATTVPDLPSGSSESTLDDVIGLLNVIVAQNNQLTERNEALAEQVASNEDEIMRLRSALEMSEETQVKMEERMGKMEKQMAALVETTRRNLTSQSQINASYASALKNMPATPPTSANTSPASMPAMPVRAAITNTPLPLSPPQAIELDLSEANIDTTKPGDIRARFQRALESQEATKNVKCCGLTRNASDMAKVRLLFRSKDDEETVRSNSGWLDTAFRGARMRGRQWYPVKVDSVNNTAVFNEKRTGLRADACEMMSKENEVEIVHARWLSKPSDRPYGSA